MRKYINCVFLVENLPCYLNLRLYVFHKLWKILSQSLGISASPTPFSNNMFYSHYVFRVSYPVFSIFCFFISVCFLLIFLTKKFSFQLCVYSAF